MMKLETKEKKRSEQRRRDSEKRIKIKANKDEESNKNDSSNETSAMKKQTRQLKKKRKEDSNESADGAHEDGAHDETNSNKFIEQIEMNVEDKTSKSREKKRKGSQLKNKKKGDSRINETADRIHGETIIGEMIGQIEMDVEKKTRKSKGKKLKGNRVNKRSREDGSDERETGKTKQPHSKAKEDEELMENKEVLEEEDVYQISSGDEDNSKGMKKWITEYHQSRPGLEELQQRIDDFITLHEEQEEKAKKEREAQAEEGGWTVVGHHKGRKKTTESDTGVTVGSVAEAVVIDNMTKKKKKEIELDFYRFQKREANKNEILSLQRKFEQDKKQIQQRRAERKFRPY